MKQSASSPEFRKHSENLAAVRRGITQVERAHKSAIRDGNEPAVETLRRLHTLTVGIFAEAFLRKIVTDPGGFNDRERGLIWKQRAQVEQWRLAIDLAFRRHYGVFIHQEIATALPATVRDRFAQVVNLVDGDLAPVIEDRNKTAHGQWIWQLKSGKDNEFKSGAAPAPLNYSAITAQFGMLEAIGRLVYALAVSEPTFDRDYETIIERIDSIRPSLDGSTYPSLESQLRGSRRPRAKTE